MTPRALLQACEKHRLACEANDAIALCDSLIGPAKQPSADQDFSALDRQFDALRRAADTANLFAAKGEKDIEALFADILPLYETHLDLPATSMSKRRADPRLAWPHQIHLPRGGGSRAALLLHGPRRHPCIAFKTRLQAAMTASGVDRALKFRPSLHFCATARRRAAREPASWSTNSSPRAGSFSRPGTRIYASSLHCAIFSASKPPQFEAWLRSRKPLFATSLFRDAVLCPPPFLAPPGTDKAPAEVPRPRETARAAKKREVAASHTPTPAEIPVGRRISAGAPAMRSACRWRCCPATTAIIAGPGSGKTVLLRRMIEEAAILGCPAIVLDVNNDLSRLGDPWEEPPADFRPEDRARAQTYFEKAEIVVFTPGVATGNPLSLRLLPDFAAIGDDSDEHAAQERREAVEMARATLEPFLGLAEARERDCRAACSPTPCALSPARRRSRCADRVAGRSAGRRQRHRRCARSRPGSRQSAAGAGRHQSAAAQRRSGSGHRPAVYRKKRADPHLRDQSVRARQR